MPVFVTLIRFTQEGLQNIKDAPQRLDAGKEAVRAAGGQFIAYYKTMGQYDAVFICELPDAAAAAKVELATGAKGSVRTENLLAFTEDEFRQSIADLP